jgi:hypothetical protein
MYTSETLSIRLSQIVTQVQAGLWYTLLVLFLALISLGFLVYEWLPGATEYFVLLGDEVDLYVAYIFLFDFWVGFFFNRQFVTRRGYWKENWLNLVSSIPVTSELTQALRVLRMIRAMRVLRVLLNVVTAKQQLRQRKHYKEHYTNRQ